MLLETGLDGSVLPVVAVYTGTVLDDPSDAELMAALGVTTHPSAARCDLAILGSGPAGLAAAVYAASEGLQTLVLEPEITGGQAGTSSLIRNYLGCISGEELAGRALDQAWLFGADFVLSQRATHLRSVGTSGWCASALRAATAARETRPSELPTAVTSASTVSSDLSPTRPSATAA